MDNAVHETHDQSGRLGSLGVPQDQPAAAGQSVLGETTGSGASATEAGVDRRGGERADAVTDGGAAPAGGAEPDLRMPLPGRARLTWSRRRRRRLTPNRHS
jgi:hypothetical protein